MLRPRHRQKSTLIYKTLGLAALVGLGLLPLLMEWGASHHVLSLIPVRLITLAPPPAPKPLPVVPKPPPPVVVAVKPVASPKPRVERVALLPRPSKVRVKPPVKPVAKPVIKPVVKSPAKPPTKPLGKTPVKSPVKAPPKPPQTVKKPSPAIAALHAAHMAAARKALAARRAKADALEKQAHQIAVAMAARRVETAGGAKPASDTPTSPPVLAPSDTLEAVPATPSSDYIPAETVSQAQPTVPDTLLVAPLHAVFRCRFVIHPDGSTTVQMVRSTGRVILDKRALAAARRWRFKPARRDGKPVESTRIVEMTFNVRPAPGE